MLLNNLDPEVAERPEELVVYGGSGRAARTHEALRGARPGTAPARRRRDAARPERQAGRRLPHASRGAARPDRELAARAALGDVGRVPAARGARSDDVRPDDRRARGSTSAPRGSCRAPTRRSPPRARRTSARRTSRGRTILTAGLGGMGGAQPLAATMAGAAILCVEVDPSRIERRLETRYLDEAADSLDDALARVRAAAADGRPLSVGLLGNAAEVVPELARRGETFDLVTDQTAAHDPLTGYVPAGLDVEEAARCATSDPDEYLRRARASIVAHVEALLEYVRRGSYVFDYGNNLRGEAYARWRREGLHIPGLRPGLYPAALLSRHRPVPVGGALRRPGRHRGDRRDAAGALSRRCAPAALARARSGTGRLPGAAGADLLARPRRSREARALRSTSSCERVAFRRQS